jgi:PilZ domain
MIQTKCPKCTGEFIRRVSRRGACELLLSFFYIYPFRCQLCSHRFKLLRWRKVYHKAFYDRRELERRPVSLKTCIWAESGDHGEGIIDDLAVTGCTMTSGSAFHEGSIVRLELHVAEDDAPIVVRSGVVRSRGTSRSEIEFLRIEHAERDRLRALVKDLAAHGGAQSGEKKAANA